MLNSRYAEVVRKAINCVRDYRDQHEDYQWPEYYSALATYRKMRDDKDKQYTAIDVVDEMYRAMDFASWLVFMEYLAINLQLYFADEINDYLRRYR